MGHIYIDLEVINQYDLDRAADGLITAEQIRRLILKNVLVDTGATSLCLPAEQIRQLGLTRFEEEEVAIATGTAKIRIFESVKVFVNNRHAVTEVMEMPEGSEPLLGALPMQRMGIVLDVASESVQFLKVSAGRGYLRM